MRFESRTLGVFEVLAVHLEADQAFDAGRLRQETLRLVERGSRRIVLDLGTIDYLYSDSINAFVALNRRMLESSGRLGILVPHPKVHEILVRAGLENIMRLYRTEAELLGDSRELMRQSSAWTRPAELQSAASASQILSATNLVPRSPEALREAASGSQRISRRRQGSRVELKSRRRDGRRTDYPGDDASLPPLPPVLPSIGSESSSLRALSRESSTFGLQVPPQTDRKPPVPPPPPAPPRASARPAAEPTVFQLPQDPEQDGYSTDAWLLALTNQTEEQVRRPSPDHDSSGFLPKLSEVDSLSSVPTEAEPVSQLDTGLRWEEEISLTEGPVSRPPSAHSAPSVHSAHSAHSTHSTPSVHSTHSVHEAPAAPQPPPFASAPSAPTPARSQADALQQAIFHEPRQVPPPAAKPAASAADWFAQMGQPSAAAAPVAPPPAAPAPRTPPPTPAGSTSGANWFGQKPSQIPQPPVPAPAPAAHAAPPAAPAPRTPPSPAGSGVSSAADWFGQKPSPAPAQVAPAAPAPAQRAPSAPAASSTSSAANWFGQKPSPAPQAPAPASAPQAHSPAESWFAQQPKPQPPPAAPVPQASAAPAPAASPAASGSRPAADWFAQPAPRTVAPTSNRPAETDSWFGKAPPASASPGASSGARVSPFSGTHPSPVSGGSTEPRPSADWFKGAATPAAPARPPRGSSRKTEPAFLDSTEMEIEGVRSRGTGLWVAVGLGIALLLVGAGVWLFGSKKSPSEVPPVTTTSSDSASGSEAGATAPVPAPASAEESEEPAAKPSEPSHPSKPVPVPVSKVKPAAPPAAPPAKVVAPPPPPPEEVHAPVKVFVTSRPSGAALLLDGKNVGTTPCEITVQRVGNLDFSLSGYRTLRKSVDPDELRGTLNVQLLSDGGGGATGRIYIQSAPQGAEILFGGRSMGRTPKMVELPVGTQSVTVKSGVQSKTKSLDIQPGQNEAEHFSL